MHHLFLILSATLTGIQLYEGPARKRMLRSLERGCNRLRYQVSVAHSSRQKSATVAHSSKQISDLDVGIESNIKN